MYDDRVGSTAIEGNSSLHELCRLIIQCKRYRVYQMHHRFYIETTKRSCNCSLHDHVFTVSAPDDLQTPDPESILVHVPGTTYRLPLNADSQLRRPEPAMGTVKHIVSWYVQASAQTVLKAPLTLVYAAA